MLWIFRFISGFLKIEFSGDNAERLINILSKNGILLWNLRYRGNKILCCTGIKDFKRIHSLHKSGGVRVRISRKIGLPFIIHRYRKRSGLVIGGVVFLILLEFLSSFIWTVEVVGNSRIKESQIIDACKKSGVYEGVPKSRVNSKNMADRLLLNLPELAWCSLNIEGCVVTVNVTEIKNQAKENEKAPSNLIATEDGIIKKIDVSSGNVLVAIGDAVARGDVLVSGIIESANSTAFIPSRGTITAEVTKDFTAEGDFSQESNYRTGKIKRRYSFDFFSVKIPLYFTCVNEKAEVESKTERLEILGRKLPFSLICETYFLTDKKKDVYTEAKLKEKLLKNIENQLSAYKNTDFTLLDEKYEPKENGMILTKTISLVTEISSKKEITVMPSSENENQ